MTQSAKLLQSRHTTGALIVAASLLAGGCASVQYSALEKVGIHKRDILVDRVEDARDAQHDTREEVISAYDELKALIGYDGGELESRYKRLDKAVERSRDARDELDDRLESIDRVSDDLFEEWEAELDLYTSDKLRADQAGKLRLARSQYAELRKRMQTARNRVNPVMAILEDNVLFLKHSLNAQALSALREQADKLEGEVDVLIREMQLAIDEADAFIASMQDA